MTTETPGVTPPVTPTPTPQPQVDVAKLTQEITEKAVAGANKIAEQSATRIATEKLSMIGRALTGEAAPDTNKIVLETFVSDPLKALHTVKEAAKKEAKQEFREEQAVKDTQMAVSSQFMPEYPELNTPARIKLVERLAEDYAAQGMDYHSALKKGFEETVKEFKLTSVSEAQKNNAVRMVGLPGGGGYSPQPTSFDVEKSSNDFFSGMKAKMNSFRNKKK